MHRILESNLKTFCEEKQISDAISFSKQFEYFVNYCVISNAYGEDFDVWDVTSEEDDAGIDGIAFIIDKELVTTLDDAKNIFSKHKNNIDVEIIFIQTKTSERYDLGSILKFSSGVEDFIKEDSLLPQGEFIKSQKKIFELLIDKIDHINNGRPNLIMNYACASENAIAKEIDSTQKNIISELENTKLFNSITFEFLGFDELTSMWNNTRDHISAFIQSSYNMSFPEMKDITQSYFVILSAKQYVENVLMDNNHKLKKGIFDENVRAFLGEENIVNASMGETIENSDSQNRFAILNNGITIISPDVK